MLVKCTNVNRYGAVITRIPERKALYEDEFWTFSSWFYTTSLFFIYFFNFFHCCYCCCCCFPFLFADQFSKCSFSYFLILLYSLSHCRYLLSQKMGLTILHMCLCVCVCRSVFLCAFVYVCVFVFVCTSVMVVTAVK